MNNYHSSRCLPTVACFNLSRLNTDSLVSQWTFSLLQKDVVWTTTNRVHPFVHKIPSTTGISLVSGRLLQNDRHASPNLVRSPNRSQCSNWFIPIYIYSLRCVLFTIPLMLGPQDRVLTHSPSSTSSSAESKQSQRWRERERERDCSSVRILIATLLSPFAEITMGPWRHSAAAILLCWSTVRLSLSLFLSLSEFRRAKER